MTQINDALAGSDELIRKLYGFLDADSELNPLLASFFSKVMGLLITRKSEMVRQNYIFYSYSKTGLKWPLKNGQNKDLNDKW